MAPKRHSGCSTDDAGTTARLVARRCGAAQSQRDERLPHARTHLRLLALGTRGLTHMPLLFDVRFNAEATVEHKGSAPSSKHSRRLAGRQRTDSPFERWQRSVSKATVVRRPRRRTARHSGAMNSCNVLHRLVLSAPPNV